MVSEANPESWTRDPPGRPGLGHRGHGHGDEDLEGESVADPTPAELAGQKMNGQVKESREICKVLDIEDITETNLNKKDYMKIVVLAALSAAL